MINKIIWGLDVLQEKFAKINKIDTDKLLTENRLDLKLRVEFLKDILETKKLIKQTMYYQFVSDNKRKELPPHEPEKMCKDFLSLFEDIRKNGISKPLNVAKLDSTTVKISYFYDGKRIWDSIPNKSGYQLMNGAHRLAIAKYLNFETVPAKIFTPMSYPFQNHTNYLKLREKDYLKKMEN
jgi:hypothetical protein